MFAGSDEVRCRSEGAESGSDKRTVTREGVLLDVSSSTLAEGSGVVACGERGGATAAKAMVVVLGTTGLVGGDLIRLKRSRLALSLS